MIKYLVMDVDGTLTDGKINIAPNGELFKAFHVRDGYAINTMLRRFGIQPVIITGRSSEIVARRSEELHIQFLFQGVSDKKTVLETLLASESLKNESAYTFENCAYIGDDLPDYECMQLIRNNGGLTGCPADAVNEIMQVSDYIAPHKGGEGAVRDFVEWIASKEAIEGC